MKVLLYIICCLFFINCSSRYLTTNENKSVNRFILGYECDTILQQAFTHKDLRLIRKEFPRHVKKETFYIKNEKNSPLFIFTTDLECNFYCTEFLVIKIDNEIFTNINYKSKDIEKRIIKLLEDRYDHLYIDRVMTMFRRGAF